MLVHESNGAVAWLNEAALRFERARGGHIVGMVPVPSPGIVAGGQPRLQHHKSRT